MDKVEMEKAKTDKVKEPKNAKGPIRYEAIVPFFVITGLIALYFTLFFDAHLKGGIEWIGSRLNGAEMNIGSLRTSFWDASLRMGKIEFTDRQAPEQNKIEVGNIRFSMLWDALLRGKAVIDLAAVTEVQMNTPRKRPGKVYPTETKSRGLEILRSQIAGTVLGDVARMLEGFDPTKELKNLGTLSSATRIAELKSALSQKEKNWSEALSSIPGEKDFSALRERLQAIQPGATKNPAEIQSQITQVNSIISEIDQKIKTVEAQGAALKSDVGAFGKSIGEIDQLIQKDLRDLESRIQLPKLDAKNIAQELFGPRIVEQLTQVERTVTLAREKLPAKSEKTKQAEPLNPPRAKGKVYQYGKPKGYPLFWLKKAEFSSQMENTAFGGNVAGELLDLSSSQLQSGKPTRFELSGDFPKSGVSGIRLSGTIERTGEVPTETLNLSVASFPVVQRALSSSESVRLVIAQATGSAAIRGKLAGDSVELGFETAFRDIEYDIGAKSKALESTLKNITRGIPTVSMQAQALGSWRDLKLNVSSNLAAALEQGFQKELQAKVAQARQELQSMIDAQTAKAKAELTGQYQGLRGRLDSQVDEKRKKAEELKSLAQNKLKSVKDQLTPAPIKAPAVQDLRKKLPIKR